MAKKQETSTNDIPNLDADWANDSTNNLPYSGASVQKFIKAQLVEISNQLWPLQLSFSVSSGVTSRTVSYSLKRKGETLTPDSVVITKKVNNNEAVVLEEYTSSVEGNVEVFSISVTKGSETKSGTITKYLASCGASDNIDNPQELIENGTSETITSALTYYPKIETANNQYAWFAIPASLSISQVKDKNTGFGMDMAEAQLITDSKGNQWKFYRTSELLSAASWTLQLI